MNLRTYGSPPYTIALLHGGPGAAGDMAPVAQELSKFCSVLEPLQTAPSLDGQVEELHAVLSSSASSPIILAGYSWGAWLGWIYAARHPRIVKKLLLISSGPFETSYIPQMHKTRMSRLTAAEREEIEALSEEMAQNDHSMDDEQRKATFARFGTLFGKADDYQATPDDTTVTEFRPDIYQSVWPEAARMRESGELLALASKILCQVVAIHGDHDPHPAEGVRAPLAGALESFSMITFEKCGHTPWRETHARDAFYAALAREITTQQAA